MKRIVSFLALVVLMSSSLGLHGENRWMAVFTGDAAWTSLLQGYVSKSGLVNYKEFVDSNWLVDGYVKELEKNGPQLNWTKEQRLAYWINLYNATTIRLILDHYPVASIKDINNGKPWDLELVTVNQRQLTLNQIEKEIILKRFNDPRVHFALNCGATSCPRLLNEAYAPERLEEQLYLQSKVFLNDIKKNKISDTELQLSMIFDWYADDFGSQDELVMFLNEFFEAPVSMESTISYLEYDWSLNSN